MNDDARKWNTRAAGWITDREPTEDGWYLVTIGPGERLVTESAWMYGQWWALDEEAEVLAWMPLPEPWKGETCA